MKPMKILKWTALAVFILAGGYILWTGYHGQPIIQLLAGIVFVVFAIDAKHQATLWLMSGAYLVAALVGMAVRQMPMVLTGAILALFISLWAVYEHRRERWWNLFVSSFK